jgi:PAS domain S-box-containing protein
LCCLTLERRLLLIVTALAAGLAGYIGIRSWILDRTRINGPIYEVITLHQRFLIDASPSRLDVMDIYAAAGDIVAAAEQGDWRGVDEHIESAARLIGAYRASVADWRRQPLGAELRPLMNEAVAAGDAFVDLLERRIVPDLRAGDVARASGELRTEGHRRVDAQRARIEGLSGAAGRLELRKERESEQLVARSTVTLDAGGFVLCAGVLLVLSITVRRSIVRPLADLGRQFEALGDGRYDTEIVTDRCDEIGTVLRALERMRVRLVEQAIARRQAEQELRIALQRYRDIVEGSIQGIYQSTPEGRFIGVNGAFVRLLGYRSADELLEATDTLATRLYVDPGQRAEFLRQLETRGSVTGFESRVRRKDGEMIWTSENARAVERGAGGEGLYYEGFIEDITDRKEAERMKADFVSFVTHQLRTPLAGIRWMLELAELQTAEDERLSCIADARVSAGRLVGLVNDLLDVYRLESGRWLSAVQSTDSVALAQSVVTELRPLAQSRGQSLDVDPAQDMPAVLVDPQLARQVILNLVSNALKYTAERGCVSVQLAATGDAVRFSVTDNGIGIPETARARLFEKFYRAENARTIDTEGTGLGLYLVRLIVQGSGGRVWCESREGDGSAFHFTLPRAQRAERAVA